MIKSFECPSNPINHRERPIKHNDCSKRKNIIKASFVIVALQLYLISVKYLTMQWLILIKIREARLPEAAM